MNMLDGKWRVADEKTCKARWSGGSRGIYFRCGFCGHRFKVGDKWRIQFTNNMPDARGNPLVCEDCDASEKELVEKWREKHRKWRELCCTSEWWWFSLRCGE